MELPLWFAVFVVIAVGAGGWALNRLLDQYTEQSVERAKRTGLRATDETPGVLFEVAQERRRQVKRYGTNDDCELGTGPKVCWLLPYTTQPALRIEGALRDDYEDFEEDTGRPTFVHLLREEFAELVAEDDPERARAEALQVAALAVSMVESMDRRRFRELPY